MIVQMAGTGGGFLECVGYITHDTAAEGEPRPETAERAAWVDTRNLPRDSRLAARVMAATAASSDSLKVAAGVSLCGRKVEDPLWHFVMSWKPGEHPSREEKQAALDEFIDYLGVGDHQLIAVEHTDTDIDHVHVALCRVSPLDGRAVKMRPGYQELNEFGERYDLARSGASPCPARTARLALEEERRQKRAVGEEPPSRPRKAPRAGRDKRNRDRKTGHMRPRTPAERHAWARLYADIQADGMSPSMARARRIDFAQHLEAIRKADAKLTEPPRSIAETPPVPPRSRAELDRLDKERRDRKRAQQRQARERVQALRARAELDRLDRPARPSAATAPDEPASPTAGAGTAAADTPPGTAAPAAPQHQPAAAAMPAATAEPRQPESEIVVRGSGRPAGGTPAPSQGPDRNQNPGREG